MTAPVVSLALVPLRGDRIDSAQDGSGRRQARNTPGLFTAGDSGGRPAAGGQAGQAGRRIAGNVVVADSLQLLRRRTDRGESTDPDIRIPPHLERRRAWREAFGLNTWHTQQLAQAGTGEPPSDAAATAVRAYRATAWRGRLDLDLAQRISVTV